jgi:tetratricopeptide (TPR) repeat protein
MGSNLGNYKEAITYFDEALAVDPNYKLALNNISDAIRHLFCNTGMLTPACN